MKGTHRCCSAEGPRNLRSAVDRNIRLTQWGYDKLYRVTTETWRQTSSPTSTVLRTFDYDYDQVGRLIELADSDPLASDFAYMYDARGQLQLEMQQHRFLGQNLFFERDFDAVGNQTLLDANIGGWVSGGVVGGGYSAFRNSYSYDRMDRLTSVTQTSRAGGHAVAPKHASFTYDAASQLTDLRRYAWTSASNVQVHSRFGRDEAGRLTSITHGGTAIAGAERWDGSATPPASLGTSELLAGYTFAFDQADRLTELRSWADGTQTAYGYDDRSQLVSAATTAITGMTPPFGLPGGEGYDFDAGGNRKSGTGTSQSATGTHNQLQTDGTYNYFYDAEGNLIRRESISGWAATLYEWDHRNRLVAVKEAPFYQYHPVYQTAYSLYVEYIYDAFDQRVGKRVEDTTDPPGIWGPEWKRYEAYVWADGQTVLRFTDSDGVGTAEPFRLASRYLWSNQVDQLLAEEQFAGDTGPSVHATTAHTTAGETLWPLTDHLGSVRGLVDNNGVIRQHVTYDSFGNRLVAQHYDTAGAPVSASHAEAVDALFGYTGRDWDADTGLQYNRARWYDPTTGRWLSQDPIGFIAGDANLYRYVGNKSTSSVDPTGQAEGHHWIPISVAWDLYKDGTISLGEMAYFAGRRSGALKNPHTWWTRYNGICHEDYSNAVKTQLRLWKESRRSQNFTMKVVTDNIRSGRTWDGRLNAEHGIILLFNSGVKADMRPLLPGRLNKMDGEGDTIDQVKSKGMTSLKNRGKVAIIFGALSSLGGALEAAGYASGSVSALTGDEMNRAMKAAEAGDVARVRTCLTGQGFPERSVYEALQHEIGFAAAVPFFDIVDPQLERLVQEAAGIQREIDLLNPK